MRAVGRFAKDLGDGHAGQELLEHAQEGLRHDARVPLREKTPVPDSKVVELGGEPNEHEKALKRTDEVGGEDEGGAALLVG